MKALATHKKILTAFLLALYTFIATPVSLWHHHKAQSPVAASVEKTIKAVSKNTTEANCPICHHHYSIISNDAILFSQCPFKHIKSFATFYVFPHLATPVLSKPNKGPPSLA